MMDPPAFKKRSRTSKTKGRIFSSSPRLPTVSAKITSTFSSSWIFDESLRIKTMRSFIPNSEAFFWAAKMASSGSHATTFLAPASTAKKESTPVPQPKSRTTSPGFTIFLMASAIRGVRLTSETIAWCLLAISLRDFVIFNWDRTSRLKNKAQENNEGGDEKQYSTAQENQ